MKKEERPILIEGLPAQMSGKEIRESLSAQMAMMTTVLNCENPKVRPSQNIIDLFEFKMRRYKFQFDHTPEEYVYHLPDATLATFNLDGRDTTISHWSRAVLFGEPIKLVKP